MKKYKFFLNFAGNFGKFDISLVQTTMDESKLLRLCFVSALVAGKWSYREVKSNNVVFTDEFTR